MKSIKRTLSMLLAILMVLGVCPLAVFANDGGAESEPPAQENEKKPYYTYYVQDGLVFLWSGEDYEIGETEQPVSSLVNLITSDKATTAELDKMMYGRQYYNLAQKDANGNPQFNAMNYRRVNGGVLVAKNASTAGTLDGNFNVLLTDAIPFTTVTEGEGADQTIIEILTDTTIEVSQSYFDTITTANGTTFNANRGYDGGSAWYGPLGYITNEKMTYGVVDDNGVRYYYGEYKDAQNQTQPFYFTQTPKTASNPLYTYADGVMTKITDQATLDLIHAQATAGTLTVNGTAKSLAASANDYASFFPIAGNGTAGVRVHLKDPFKAYDGVGKPQFLNNTIKEAFTTTMIYDYAAVQTQTTFDFFVGRDGLVYGAAVEDKAYNAKENYSKGATYGGTTGEYNGVTYTKNETFLGFVGSYDNNYATNDSKFPNMLAAAVADEGRNFAFSYGVNIPTVLHAIRIYDRVLNDAEIAQNHFVDIAMRVGADLSAYDAVLAREDADKVLPYVYSITAGKDEGDFDKESFEAAILDAVYEADKPKFSELYVQEGLSFFWLGEGNELGEKTPATLTDARNGLSISKATNGRETKKSYLPSKSPSLYQIDKGVVFDTGGSCNKLILNDLIPTRTLASGKTALADMTLEVSQAYPEYYRTSASGDPILNKRGNDGGGNYFGPIEVGYTKSAPGGIYAGGKWYAAFTYTNPTDAEDVREVYLPSFSSAPQTFSYYDYDPVTGILTELGQLTRLTDASAPGNTASALSPTVSQWGMLNSHANSGFVDSYGVGPLMNWNSVFTAYDAYGKPQFMNSTAGDIFTTTMVFDYDYTDSDLTSESYGYKLGIGRDGLLLSDAAVTNTYDANKDYTVPDTTSNDAKWKEGDNANFAFTYGLSAYAVEYYSIRLYDRVLEEKEIAQNHFVDIAYQLSDEVTPLLTEYASASQAVKDRIHMTFASYAAADFTAESFESTLRAMLDAKGFFSVEGMDNAVSFDGFAGALRLMTGIRAQFTADADVLAAFERAGVQAELGVLVSPTDDPTVLTVSYDHGVPVASEGAILRVAYKTDTTNNFFYETDEAGEKLYGTTFALAVTNPTNGITLDLASEICFRAYLTLSDGTDVTTFYYDAEGETLGDSTSFNEVYRYLYMNGYAEYESVKLYEEEILAVLARAEEELAAMNGVMDKINAELADADEFIELHDKFLALAPAKADDPFLSLYYAQNAMNAVNMLEAVADSLNELDSEFNTAFDALKLALAGEDPDADAVNMAEILTAGFRRQYENAFAYVDALGQREDLITVEQAMAYLNLYDALFEGVTPVPFRINGLDCNNYAILASEETLAAAKALSLGIGYTYGVANYVPVVDAVFTEEIAPSGLKLITLESNANLEFGKYGITVEENGNITLAGEGDNGAYHAVMAFVDEYIGAENTDFTVTDTEGSYRDVMAQSYAAESFLREDGTLDTESDGELNVVFIGGSLTELGKSVWTEGVAEYLRSVFPNKTVNHINSGVGGTNSEGAAARFCEHVAPYSPDIIFIEFTVNDDMNNFKSDRAQYRMENFLYQCSLLEKIPTVVYLHTPPATMPNSGVYNEWYQQVEYKEEWAAHYGVKTVNIFDYSYGKFEKEKAAGGESDYITWLDTYYGTLQDEIVGNNGKYGRYDVHGGYQLYLEAVVEALEANAAEILKPYRFAPYMHPEKTADIERTYVSVAHDDEMFSYSTEGWAVYKQYDAAIHGGSKEANPTCIPTGRWNFPFLVNGVHQGDGFSDASFTFKTNANSLTLYYMSVYNDSTNKIYNAGQFEVWVDGINLGTVNTGSSYAQPFISSTIDLKNPDNEELTVTVKVSKTNDAALSAFARFTSIWFGYNADNPHANQHVNTPEQ